MIASHTTHRTSNISLSVVAAGLFLAACESSAPPVVSTLSVQVDSTGAVPIVRVSGEAPEWTIDSLAVIRADPEVGFSGIRSIALDPRGGVWVADTREGRLSRWGNDGRWIEDLGRVGGGPGEFRSPNSVVVHDNGLFVHDVGNSRVVRFDLATGTDTSWLTTSRISGDPMSVRLYPNSTGPLLFDLLRTARPPRTLFVGVTGVDSLLAPPPGERAGNAKVCPVGEALRFFSSPFAPLQAVVPVGGRVVETAADGSYHLNWHDAGGVLQHTVARVAARAAISDAEFRTANEDWEQFSESMGAVRCEGEIVRYAEKSSIRALLPDADGRLWVEQQGADGVRYEVWSNDSLLAQLAAPERSLQVPPSMLDDRLAVARSLPDGGQEVRLYRVVRSRQ